MRERGVGQFWNTIFLGAEKWGGGFGIVQESRGIWIWGFYVSNPVIGVFISFGIYIWVFVNANEKWEEDVFSLHMRGKVDGWRFC